MSSEHQLLFTMPTATDVYLTARELVGTPYIHQGRRKDIGIDCVGVPIWVARKLELEIEDVQDYGRLPDGTMLDRIAEVCEPGVLVPGALAVFQIVSVPQHCGIISRYMDGLGFIHAWDVAKVVCEHRLTFDWRDRLVGCYKLPGVHYG